MYVVKWFAGAQNRQKSFATYERAMAQLKKIIAVDPNATMRYEPKPV
jgi:hypothetical protein